MLGVVVAMETFCGQAYGAKKYHTVGVVLQVGDWMWMDGRTPTWHACTLVFNKHSPSSASFTPSSLSLPAAWPHPNNAVQPRDRRLLGAG